MKFVNRRCYLQFKTCTWIFYLNFEITIFIQIEGVLKHFNHLLHNLVSQSNLQPPDFCATFSEKGKFSFMAKNKNSLATTDTQASQLVYLKPRIITIPYATVLHIKDISPKFICTYQYQYILICISIDTNTQFFSFMK